MTYSLKYVPGYPGIRIRVRVAGYSVSGYQVPVICIYIIYYYYYYYTLLFICIPRVSAMHKAINTGYA